MGFESFPKFEDSTEVGERTQELTPEAAIREEKEVLDKRSAISGKAKALIGAFMLMTAISCKPEGKFEVKGGESPESGRPAAVRVEEEARPDRARVVRTQEFSGYGIKTKTGFNKYGEIVWRETPHGREVLIGNQ